MTEPTHPQPEQQPTHTPFGNKLVAQPDTVTTCAAEYTEVCFRLDARALRGADR